MRMLTASLLIVASPLFIGCLTVQPRVAAPLPSDGLAVGVGGAAIATPSVSWIGGVATATTGAQVAWQALKGDRFSIEIDGGAGGGVVSHYSQHEVLGGLAGARGWMHMSKRTAFGIDAAVSGMYALASIQDPVSNAPEWGGQVEARMLAATQLIDDFLWIGARPGAAVTIEKTWLQARNGPPPMYLDIPVSLTMQMDRVRFGVELGVSSFLLPPVPMALHAGMTAAYVF